MTTFKTLSNNQLTPLLAFAFKIVGILFIAVPLIDIIILSVPFQILDRQWQIFFATQAIERGALPLLGLSFLLAGYWIGDTIDLDKGDRPKARRNLFSGVMILSSLLGLFFLLIIPFYLNNIRLSYVDATNRINEEVQQVKTQLENDLQAQLTQQRTQFEQLLADPTQFEQVLATGQFPPEELKQLQELQNKSQSLDQFMDKRLQAARQQIQPQIDDAENRQKEALNQVNVGTLKASLRSGINGLLLIIAYTAVGWVGLKNQRFSDSKYE